MIITDDGFSIEQYPTENKIVIITPQQPGLTETELASLVELVRAWSKEKHEIN